MVDCLSYFVNMIVFLLDVLIIIVIIIIIITVAVTVTDIFLFYRFYLKLYILKNLINFRHQNYLCPCLYFSFCKGTKLDHPVVRP